MLSKPRCPAARRVRGLGHAASWPPVSSFGKWELQRPVQPGAGGVSDRRRPSHFRALSLAFAGVTVAFPLLPPAFPAFLPAPGLWKGRACVGGGSPLRQAGPQEGPVRGKHLPITFAVAEGVPGRTLRVIAEAGGFGRSKLVSFPSRRCGVRARRGFGR